MKLGGNVVQLLAGAQAAGATIAALFGREIRGRGDHVDISIMQTQAGSPDRRTPMLVGYQYTGHVNRQGEVSVSPVRPCKDGHVNVYVAPSRLADIYDMMGMPELKEDPRFGDPVQVLRPENTEALEGILIGWLMDRSMVGGLAGRSKRAGHFGPGLFRGRLAEGPPFPRAALLGVYRASRRRDL